MPLNLIDWDDLKKRVMTLPKEDAHNLLNAWQSDLTANLTAVRILQKAVDDPRLKEDIKDKGWAEFEKEIRSVKKPAKRNCPNCIYCHILEEKDKRMQAVKRRENEQKQMEEQIEELENDPKVANFINKMKTTYKKNPQFRSYVKNFLGGLEEEN